MGCRVAGRPDAELRVSETSFLFDAVLSVLETPSKYCIATFIPSIYNFGGKEHPEVIQFNLIDRGRFEKEHSALILSDLHTWGSDRSE